MAQIFLTAADAPGANSYKRLSLVDVLEDGIHAGNAIIGPVATTNWFDPPLPGSGFWIVDITDATRAQCLFVVQPLYDAVNDVTLKKRRYRVQQNRVPNQNIQEILATGRTSMTFATLNSIIVDNPGHS